MPRLPYIFCYLCVFFEDAAIQISVVAGNLLIFPLNLFSAQKAYLRAAVALDELGEGTAAAEARAQARELSAAEKSAKDRARAAMAAKKAAVEEKRVAAAAKKEEDEARKVSEASAKAKERAAKELLVKEKADVDAAANAAAKRKAETDGFISAASFDGARAGLVFRNGELGTGYYPDIPITCTPPTSSPLSQPSTVNLPVPPLQTKISVSETGDLSSALAGLGLAGLGASNASPSRGFGISNTGSSPFGLSSMENPFGAAKSTTSADEEFTIGP